MPSNWDSRMRDAGTARPKYYEVWRRPGMGYTKETKIAGFITTEREAIELRDEAAEVNHLPKSAFVIKKR